MSKSMTLPKFKLSEEPTIFENIDKKIIDILNQEGIKTLEDFLNYEVKNILIRDDIPNKDRNDYSLMFQGWQDILNREYLNKRVPTGPLFNREFFISQDRTISDEYNHDIKTVLLRLGFNETDAEYIEKHAILNYYKPPANTSVSIEECISPYNISVISHKYDNDERANFEHKRLTRLANFYDKYGYFSKEYNLLEIEEELNDYESINIENSKTTGPKR